MKKFILFINCLTLLVIYNIYILHFSFTKSSQSLNRKNELSIDFSNMSYIFSDIYLHNKWIKGSGFGSTKECTKQFLPFLDKVLKENKIMSIVDYGCGDWQMLSNYKFSSMQQYYGFDLVDSVIDRNKRIYGRKNIHFYKIKNINEIKVETDLIMVKDVLQHWNNDNIIKFLKNVVPRYKYALITNYISNESNVDIKPGLFRSINLESPPYNVLSFKWKKDMYFCNEMKRIYFYSHS